MKPRHLNREEKRIIRSCACRSAGFGAVEICSSTKIGPLGKHMNIWMCTNDPEYRDTDLFDNAFSWKETEIEFTPDGRCAIDFYVYAPIGRECDKELQTNVTAFWENRKLVRVEGTCNGTMWSLS